MAYDDDLVRSLQEHFERRKHGAHPPIVFRVEIETYKSRSLQLLRIGRAQIMDHWVQYTIKTSHYRLAMSIVIEFRSRETAILEKSRLSTSQVDSEWRTIRFMDKKNIVILGAGFGGIVAAQKIAKGLTSRQLLEKYQVILIDRNDYQIYTPTLYEDAAKGKDAKAQKNSAWPVASLIRSLPIKLMTGEVGEIDLMGGDIHLATGEEIMAEFLVVALGSESNDFGIPGVKEHAVSMKTFADAQKISAAIAELLEKNPNPKIVVAGAGPNGIEVASEIKYRHPRCEVTIVEAMPTILPGLDANVAVKLSRRLAKLSVNVRLNAKIAQVNENAVALADGTNIPFDLMLWTAGVKAPALVTALPLRAERGKPLSDPNMSCVPQAPDLQLAPMVYAIGDAVCFMNPATQKSMPTVAPVAIEQAEIASWNILEEISKKENSAYAPRTKTYSPQTYPYVIPSGGSWAIAKIGPFILTGWPAHVFERFVELDYLLTILPFGKAIGTWLS